MKIRYLFGVLALVLIVGSIYGFYIWTTSPFRMQIEMMWVQVAAVAALISGLFALVFATCHGESSSSLQRPDGSFESSIMHTLDPSSGRQDTSLKVGSNMLMSLSPDGFSQSGSNVQIVQPTGLSNLVYTFDPSSGQMHINLKVGDSIIMPLTSIGGSSST